MSKIDIDKELAELISRFKRLKKAIEEEESPLTKTQQSAVAAAQAFIKERLAKKAPDAEAVKAQNLANLLKSKGILGSRPPPRQPTDQEMFGHLVPDEKAVAAAEKNWGNAINNWLAEASKPLNSRFSSPEEEQAYWDNIKVSDGGGDNHGY